MIVAPLFSFYKCRPITLEHLSDRPGYLNSIKKTLAGQVSISTLLALTGACGLHTRVNGGSAVALGTDEWIDSRGWDNSMKGEVDAAWKNARRCWDSIKIENK